MNTVKRKKPKYNTKENYQTTREETMRRRKQQRTTKTTRTQSIKWKSVYNYQ